MTFDDETLSAYVDGELDPTTIAEIETAAATDAVLAQRIEKLRRSTARRVGESRPSTAEIIRFQTKPQAKPPSKSQPKISQAAKPHAKTGLASPTTRSGLNLAALLASLSVGVIIGVIAPWKSASDPAMSPGRAVTAALNRQASGADTGAVRIGVTFKSKSGVYCRTFWANATAGLACHEGAAWTVRAAAPASTHTPKAVSDVMDAMIAGAPLDPATEAQVRKAGWK